MELRNYSTIIQFLIILSLGKLEYVSALLGQDVRTVFPDELAFVVSLSYDNDQETPANNHFCTGTLITDRAVLTAKHCAVILDIDGPIVIRAGSPSLQETRKYAWESWISYEDWAKQNDQPIDPQNDDIAVIKLKKRVPKIQPAKLCAAINTVKEGLQMFMAGWGDLEFGIHPNYLLKVSVKRLSLQECMRRTEPFVPGLLDWERKICTNTDAESGHAILGDGDSGGPLYNEHYCVIGVNIGSSPGGDEPLEKQVNAHNTVHFYRNFIRSFLP